MAVVAVRGSRRSMVRRQARCRGALSWGRRRFGSRAWSSAMLARSLVVFRWLQGVISQRWTGSPLRLESEMGGQRAW